MCITRTDKSGGGVSQGISRKERKGKEKRFNYPSQLWQNKHMEHTAKWPWISEQTITHGHNHIKDAHTQEVTH